MTKNPLINALCAVLYIVLVATFIFNGSAIFGKSDTIFIPIAMLSLFVFSAACMGCIFLYQPLQMFLEGKKKEAVDLFLKTLLAFALSAIATVAVGLYLL